MNKCVSIKEMRQLEALTVDSGICEFDLLCSAGIGAGRLIAEYLRKMPKTQAKRVVILAGGGKNGGDGFVVADYLQENTDFPVFIYLKDHPGELRGIAGNYFSQIEDEIHWQQINELEEEDFLPGDIIVDALCGIGCTTPLCGRIAQWVKTVNRLSYPVISLDIPSGLNADTGCAELAVKADYTISMGMCKKGLVINEGPRYCGKLAVSSIGIPQMYTDALPEESITYVDETLIAPFFKRRANDAYKNSVGRVLIIAGSLRYPGAAKLAVMGALRGGGGMVHLAYPAHGDNICCDLPAAVLRHPVSNLSGGFFDLHSIAEIDLLTELADFIVIGPGIGRNDATIDFLRHVLKIEKPMLIDADALTLLSSFPDAPEIIRHRCCGTDLTPHVGELRGLLTAFAKELQIELPDEITWGDERIKHALVTALKLNCIVLHKGCKSIIASPEGEIAVNSSGSPALATAGSGDVLSGLIGAFASSGEMSLFNAVICGVFVHGRAGENTPLAMRSLIADDLPDLIAGELRKLSPFA